MTGRQPNEDAILQLARKISRPEDRATYLDQICKGNETLRGRVELLLEAEVNENVAASDNKAVTTLDSQQLAISAGQQIGRYQLLQKIGEGGFGVVFMAEQQQPVRRKVALKVIKPGMDTSAVIARFEAERQALAMMDHENISRVLDGGATESGRPYFVMELVKGVPITEYCDKNHFSTPDRLALFIKVCRAVQHAHQKGVIHRDLKPSNILVTLHDGQPVVKVIDFGVAKAINQQLTERTLFTAYGQMVGTPQYMSPEQAEMSGLDIDTRSDLYSLGVLLYELLTGETPLNAERLKSASYAEVQRIIQEEEPPKPSTRISSSGDRITGVAKHRSVSAENLHRQLRGDLDWIVMKALEKDRSRRYDTATGLVNDIQRHLNEEPVEASPPSATYRMQKFVRRNQRTAAALLAVGLSLILGICATSLALIRAQHHAKAAEANAATAAIEAENARQANKQLEDTNAQLTERNAQISQMLLHTALAAAMNADEQETVRLTEMASQANASESQTELLKGLLQGSLGVPQAALPHLERAVELEPTSIPALCATSRCYFELGHYRPSRIILGKALRLPAETAEDYMFLGVSHKLETPHRAISFLERSLKLHNSPLTRMFYAQALGWRAFYERDIEIAKAGLKELGSAELLLSRDHSEVMVTRLQLLDVLIALRRSQGLLGSDLEQHLAEANASADYLMTTPNPGQKVFAAFHYNFVDRNLDATERAWERALELGVGSSWKEYYATFLLKKYGLEKAIAELDSLEAPVFYTKVHHVCLQAFSPTRRDAAERWWQDNRESILSETINGPTLSGNLSWAIMVPSALGDSEALRILGRNWTQQLREAGRPTGMIDFFQGLATEQEYLAEDDSPWSRYLVAIKGLAARNPAGRAKAEEQFRAVLQMGNYWGLKNYVHHWADSFLAEMKRNPGWPGKD